MSIDRVYIVTSGEYSGYGIDGVFIDKSAAEAFVASAPKGEGLEIEEWPIGPRDGKEFRQWWAVFLSIETGDEITDLHPGSFHGVGRYPAGWSESRTWRYEQSEWPGGEAYGKSVVSREHALKIAAEARQAYLRQTGASL